MSCCSSNPSKHTLNKFCIKCNSHKCKCHKNSLNTSNLMSDSLSSNKEYYCDDLEESERDCYEKRIDQKKPFNFNLENSKTNQKKQMIFYVSGMTCGQCALTLTKSISQIPDVFNVNVSFATGKLSFFVDEKIHNQIIQIVENFGYQISEEGKLSKDNNIDKNTFYFSITSIFLALIFDFIFSLHFLSNIFYLISLLLSGYKVLKSAFYALKTYSIDMNVLLMFASIGSILLGEVMEGAMVIFLFHLGSVLQIKALSKTHNSVRSLLDLTPQKVLLKSGQEKYAEEILIGEIIIVKAGEKIALDGVIVKGESFINQSAITGESLPVFKKKEDKVFAGTINENSLLEIQVTKTSENSTIANIFQMVEKAQNEKVATEEFIDKFAKIYTPIVFLISLFVMFFIPLFVSDWTKWVMKGLEILIVACPCALVLSTPISIVTSLGKAAKNGILVKSGNVFDIARNIKAICFDKTGTITSGNMEVVKITSLSEKTEKDILQIAANLEINSNHPIAKSILRFAKNQNLTIKRDKAEILSGFGLKNDKYIVGSLKLFKQKLDSSTSNTTIFVGNENEVFGFIELSDIVREESLDVINQLSYMESFILTGDSKNISEKIAQKVGISNVFFELLPEQKLEKISQLKNTMKVAMVGDGINDAPALASSDLSIAMGFGSDTSKEVADIVLISDNLNKIPFLFKLSKYTMNIIHQNIFLSIFVKIIALICICLGILPMWLAVFADTGMTFLVVLNSLRINLIKNV